MQLQPWIDQISQVDGLRDVGGSAALATVRADTRVTPAAYVIPVSEQAGDNTMDTAIVQRVRVHVGVVIAVRNVRDRRGASGHQALETIRDAVIDALLGWTPADASAPVEYVRGRLVEYNDATLWWQDEFRTDFYLRQL